jgi:hypothetical protein
MRLRMCFVATVLTGAYAVQALEWGMREKLEYGFDAAVSRSSLDNRHATRSLSTVACRSSEHARGDRGQFALAGSCGSGSTVLGHKKVADS